jgi:phage repressor protein C with HTH and peptisase S24 domain
MANIISIIERIKEHANIKSDSAVAELLGMNQSTFAERKRKNSVPYDELEGYCQKEGLSFGWAITGEGPARLGGQVLYSSKEMVAESSSAWGDEFILIPRMTGNISAGGGLIPDNTVEMKVAFRKDWISRRGDPQNMSLVRVSGDSMEPTLLSGDLILVDHGRNFVDAHGGLYAVSMDHSIMIKRVQVIHTTGKLKIISDNSRYEPIEADPLQVKVNGKVIWFGRELER